MIGCDRDTTSPKKRKEKKEKVCKRANSSGASKPCGIKATGVAIEMYVEK